jgi:hypothetical protein
MKMNAQPRLTLRCRPPNHHHFSLSLSLLSNYGCSTSNPTVSTSKSSPTLLTATRSIPNLTSPVSRWISEPPTLASPDLLPLHSASSASYRERAPTIACSSKPNCYTKKFQALIDATTFIDLSSGGLQQPPSAC